MREPWSREEVEVIVADYFSMFLKQLRGQRYKKSDHRLALVRQIGHRTARAVEYKHMNISAALNDLGFPHLPGYIPLQNYQHLLLEVVAQQLEEAKELRELVSRQVDQPASEPHVMNILDALVDPPRLRKPAKETAAEVVGRFLVSAPGPRFDYLAREASNRELGLKGEKFVIEFERERLRHAGRGKFASHVEHVAETCGDRMGFDILSYEVTGQQRLIEVKTTQFARETPFYVTRNELAVSHQRADHYYLYRVFAFEMGPKLFNLRGALDETCTLEPTVFRGSVARTGG